MHLRRRNRKSTDHHHPKASTSHELTDAEGILFRPRRHKSIANGDDLFLVRPAGEDNNVAAGIPRLYAGAGGHPAASSPHSRGTSTASVIVFAFALSGILLVFLLFYFLAKICSPSEEDIKDGRGDSSQNGIRRVSIPRKMANGGKFFEVLSFKENRVVNSIINSHRIACLSD
jgi:hypothetical protein